MSGATINIRWVLDVVDRGETAKMLKQDRAIRTGLAQTDAQYHKTAASAASASARQVQASQRAATATRQEGRAQVTASAEVQRYAAAQREALTIGSRIIAQSAEVTAGYRREGRAASASAAQVSRAARIRASAASAARRGAGAVIGAGAAVGGAVRNAASTAGVGVGLAGFAGVAVAAKETIGFDKALRNVNSIAQLSEKRLQAVGAALRSLAGKTAQAPKTLAEGMYDLVSSGFNAKQSLTIVGAAARAATAGLTTTDVSTKAVAAVLNAYHLSADKARAVSDTLFATVNRGVITFEDLASNIGTVLPFASSLGVNLGQVGAAISTMTKQGISGELSITFLKNAMVSFLKPSVGMAAALKKTGASSAEALIKQKTFAGALKAVIATTDGSKKSIAKLFPNIRSLTAALALTGKNSKSAAADIKFFKNTSGQTSLALSQQSQSISYQWKKLKAEASSLAIGLGTKLVPAGLKVLGVLTSIGNKSTPAGGAVSSVLGGLSAGLKGHDAPSKVTAAPRVAGHMRGPDEVQEPSKVAQVAAKIGQGARTIGTAAVSAGKQLLDAFKPALPFLQNILLPLLIGIGKGVLGSVVAAFKVLVPIIKVVATVLGAVGRVAAPFKSVIEGIGTVIGFVAAGPILKFLGALGKIGIVFKILAVPVRLVTGLFGLAGKAIGKLPSVLQKLGGLLEKVGGWFGKLPGKIGSVAGGVLSAAGHLAISAGKGLASLPAKLAVNAYSAGRAVIDKLGSWIGKAGSVARKIASVIVGAIRSLPGKVAGLASDLVKTFADLGKKIVSAIVKGIKSAPGAVIDAIKSLVPNAAKGVVDKALGLADKVNPVKLFKRRGGVVKRYQGGGLVDAFVSPGEQVLYGASSWTVPGPRTAADSVFARLPVGAAVLTGDGQSRMSAGASIAEAIATQAPHFAAGGIVRGKVSTFGPPTEPRGKTASGATSGARGVAIRPGATYQSGRSTLGQYWRITIAGHSGALKQTDLGPNESTGRRIDVTGAGAKFLGIDPRHFPTDSTGTAELLGKSAKGAKGSVKGRVPIILGRSRSRAGLVADALSQGVDAGAAGLTRAEIARANRGARGAELSPIIAAIAEQTGAVDKASSSLSVIKGGTAKGSGGAARLESVASRIKVPYVYGGGHSGFSSNPAGLDCSGYLSDVLHFGGASPTLKAPAATGGLSSYGQSGAGRYVTIHIRNSAPAHTMLTIGGRGYSSGNRATGRLSGRNDVSAAYLSTLPTKRHPIGLRRGGIIGRFRTGGSIPGAGGALSTGVSRALTFAGGSLNKLDEVIGHAAQARLDALYKAILARVRKGGDAKTVKRLQAVLSLIDFEVGRRIGALQASIEKRTTGIEHGQNVVDRTLRKQGLDTSSVAGLNVQAAADAQQTKARQKNVADAKRALAIAKRTGNRQQIAAAASQLTQAQEDLDESVTKGIEDTRALVIATQQDVIDRTSRAIEEAHAQLDRSLRKAGVDAGSAAGIAATTGVDDATVAMRASVVDSVSAALAHTADAGARQQLTDQLNQARSDLDEALTVQIEDRRALIRQAAQEAVDTASFGVDSIQNALSGLDISERLNRTAETPAGLLQKAQAIQSQLIPVLQNSLAALNKQYGALLSIQDSAGARQVLLSIQQAGNDIASALADSADLIRQAAEQAAQETVDRAAHGTSLAQLGEQRLELEQRLAGTFDAGGQSRADYINQVLIPSLNTELAALNAQLNTASKEGDATLANQIAEAIAGKQNELLQSQLDAMEEVAQNTSDRKVGGTLGFNYGNESLSDAIIAVGNGS